MKVVGVIYRAFCIVTGKSYIGQTNSFNQRQYNHLFDTDKGSKLYFHRALRKYSQENFIWSVICRCSSKFELIEMEKFFIKFFNSHNSSFGYNSTEGGEGTVGHHHTPETKQILRDINLGSVHSEEQNRKQSEKMKGMKNHTQSETTKQILREINLGKSISDITIVKIKETWALKFANGYIHATKGTKRTKEQKLLQKLRYTKEFCDTMSQIMLQKYADGYVHPMKDRHHTEVSIEKMKRSKSGSNNPMSKENRMRRALQLKEKIE